MDHCAVVANIREGKKRRLKSYWRVRQKFPLSLPLGPKDANTTTFDKLAAKCVDPQTKRAPRKDWVSERTWKLLQNAPPSYAAEKYCKLLRGE